METPLVLPKKPKLESWERIVGGLFLGGSVWAMFAHSAGAGFGIVIYTVLMANQWLERATLAADFIEVRTGWWRVTRVDLDQIADYRITTVGENSFDFTVRYQVQQGPRERHLSLSVDAAQLPRARDYFEAKLGAPASWLDAPRLAQFMKARRQTGRQNAPFSEAEQQTMHEIMVLPPEKPSEIQR